MFDLEGQELGGASHSFWHSAKNVGTCMPEVRYRPQSNYRSQKLTSMQPVDLANELEGQSCDH
jgi:hypothetical protein